MPLTDYQAGLARLLSDNRTFDSYLAGGAAIHIEPNTTRYSHDLDCFHDSESRVAQAFEADREVLEAAGYSIEVDLDQRSYIRAIVRKSLLRLAPAAIGLLDRPVLAYPRLDAVRVEGVGELTQRAGDPQVLRGQPPAGLDGRHLRHRAVLLNRHP